MVTKVSGRWSRQFWVKINAFSTSFDNNKINKVAKIMQSAYLCVIFHVKHKKLLFLAVLTCFLILGKIQDGDHCRWRHRPSAAPLHIKYTSSCWEDETLSSEGKIVSEYCNISKTLGRNSIPPSPLCNGGGMTLRARLAVYVYATQL